jgi:thiol-disulfide isomerase/thioredoxin
MGLRAVVAVGLAVLVSGLGGCGSTAANRRPPAQAVAAGRLEVVLINGGARKRSNVRSHLAHLKGVLALLDAGGVARRDITVFCADGADPAPDMAVRRPDRLPAHWLLDGTRLGRLLSDLVYESSQLEGVRLLPATRGALATWFHAMHDELGPGDTLLLYVTDHGVRRGKEPTVSISLWGERLELEQLGRWLDRFSPGVRLVFWMSQCYAGAFNRLIHGRAPKLALRPNRCGVFSTLPDRPAWGCFPESTADSPRLGHSLRLLELLRPGMALGPAHDRVLLADRSPNVPHRSSQSFARALLQRRARSRGRPLARLADGLLARAWSRTDRFRAERRLADGLGAALGLGRVRSLLAIEAHERGAAELRRRSRTFKRRWRAARRDLSRSAVADFVAAHPEWNAEQLPALMRAHGLKYGRDMRAERERRRLAEQLLAELEPWVAARRGLHQRLDRLHRRELAARELHLRQAVRRGMLLRLRLVLESVAGAVLAAGDPALRARWQALRRCEAWRLPGPAAAPPAWPAPPALPALEAERAALAELRPSWLGVRYGPEDAQRIEQHGLAAGAVVVRSVVPDSPAAAAGFQRGDTILGRPGAPFERPDALRETVMLAAAGRPLALEVLRGEQRLVLRPELAPFPDAIPDRPDALEPDSPAPAITGLRAWQGDIPAEPPVLLFFYATWCGPCKQLAAALPEWERRHGIPVLAVSQQQRETLQDFFAGYQRAFPARRAIDPRGLISDAFRATALPTLVLIDARGRVAAYARGSKALEQKAFRAPAVDR